MIVKIHYNHFAEGTNVIVSIRFIVYNTKFFSAKQPHSDGVDAYSLFDGQDSSKSSAKCAYWLVAGPIAAAAASILLSKIPWAKGLRRHAAETKLFDQG